ncbi:hypothetical protein [Flavobacterium orientale]|uniref:Uncharacterized protein n=1 Tax=Flavobacterium orientale TaxID=1756020 RepID=A0A917DDF2_9FLAO|nr:hypothetical protein [Flavobacterium orientale]GGD29134.1 hypothetical protein GCM10011343_19090 [Flavobacterium orientale]
MFRIVLGSLLVIVTMLAVPSVEKALFYLPLVFALSVSLPNLDKLKTSRPLGILLTLGQSYLVFLGLAIVIYFFDEWLIAISSEEITEYEGIIMITIGGYLAALLLFYFHSFLFKVNNLKFSFLAITTCYVLVVIVMLVFSKNDYLQFGVEKFPSFLISWCIFMSLAYSISLNKDVFLSKTKLKQG